MHGLSGDVSTLTDLLLQQRSNNGSVIFIKSSTYEEKLSYVQLFHAATRTLGCLQERGIKVGDNVILQTTDPREFIISFWACVLGGIIPVPLKFANTDEEFRKVQTVCECLNDPYVVLPDNNLDKFLSYIARNNKERLKIFESRCLTNNDLLAEDRSSICFNAQPDDIAYIQFSSGSTNSPKGIILTHRNLITNIRAILSGIDSPPEGDIFFSWMPLTHDMGLIGYHLTPIYAGWDHYIMPTELFIRHPLLWLQKMSEHKATFTASPNFGYKYLLSHLQKDKLCNIDLSAVRIITNGAEPIAAGICRKFEAELQEYGLRPNVIFPVYGLAEASLAVTFSTPGSPVDTISLDRQSLNIGEKVCELQHKQEGVEFVNLGKSLQGNCSVRIVLEDGKLAAENTIGYVQIMGENVTAGYYNNPAANADLHTADGWLKTGDLGLIKNGNLYITGRSKDIIFLNGSNIYPHDVENRIEQSGMVEAGKIAVAACFNQAAAGEEVVAFVVYKGKLEEFIAIVRQIRQYVNKVFGFQLDKVLPVARIPKTTSGKFQRYKLIRQYQEGFFIEADQHIRNLLATIDTQEEYTPPQNEIEVQLLEIWKDILNVSQLGVTNHFFEAGGNSLKVALLTTKIQEVFGIELEIRQLFTAPTIRLQAAIINAQPASVLQRIPSQEEQPYYPLSFAQEGIYYFWELNRSSVAYNMPMAFRISGTIDTDKLQETLRTIIIRHDILRTSFAYIEDRPLQFVKPAIDFTLRVEQLQDRDIYAALHNQVLPFDLHQGPLLRMSLLRSENELILFMDFHHIIFDGYSYALFIKELTALYGGQILATLQIQYKDFSTWEQHKYQNGPPENLTSYWNNTCNKGLQLLHLPLNCSRPPAIDYIGQKLPFRLDNELSQNIRLFAQQKGITPYVFFLTVYNILLGKYTGQDDIVIGVPAMVREHPDLQQQFGMFVNNLVVCNQIDARQTFSDFLENVHRRFLDVLDHRAYPFAYIVKHPAARRNKAYHPAFDAQLVFQQFGDINFSTTDFYAEQLFFDPAIAKYDLTFELIDTDETFLCNIEYATALFSKESIQGLYHSFVNLLYAVLDKPTTSIADISLLSDIQLEEHIHTFNNTAIRYPATCGVAELIENQIHETPDNIAVYDGERTLSYAELGHFSTQLAAWLHNQGIGKNTPVAIVLDRSIELIIAITGTMISGGCYVPVDTSLPAGRISYLLTDSRSKVLITTSEWFNMYKETVSGWEEMTICLLDNPEAIPVAPALSNYFIEEQDLAYIIYTSGSTGTPKGVMIEHRSAANYLRWAAGVYTGNKPANFALYTSVSFDLTITSILLPLIIGGSIILFREEDDTILINKVVADHRVDIVKATPSHLKILKEYPLSGGNTKILSSVKVLIVGGEALYSELADEITALFGNTVSIYNEYGPTEATVGCMIHLYDPQVDTGLMVPIGHAIHNMQVYLLDRYLQPVTVNVPGEIYVSGDGLARGYLYNEELTTTKFVPHTFVPGKRMYKTGDLAVRDNNGMIFYIGRADDQIKINGYRIEPGEITAILLKHTAVASAIVIKREDGKGSGYLCAYFTTRENQNVLPDELMAFATTCLPAYMLPARYIQLDSIPLTTNGKVAIDDLPAPSRDIRQQDTNQETYDTATTILIEVWQEVLNESSVNIDDNFTELGGDSIKAVQVASRLFNYGLSLRAKDILQLQTIRALRDAKVVIAAENHYQQSPVTGEKALTPIEHWFFGQDFEVPDYYTQSVLLEWHAEIDSDRLQVSLSKIISHHDSLRLNYEESKHCLYISDAPVELYTDILEVDLTSLSSISEEEGIISTCISLRKSIDIRKGKLFRVAILKGRQRQLLFLTVHHLGIDGYSWRILLEDLKTVYMALNGKRTVRLPPKTASVKDWYTHLRSLAASAQVLEQLPYWNNILAQQHAVLSHPGLVRQIEGKLERHETAFLLQEANKLYNTNTLTLLLSALAIALPELTGTRQTIIELEHHGRTLEGIDVSRTLGWFTSMYPFLLQLPAETDTGSVIATVKTLLGEIPQEGTGYGLLRYLLSTWQTQPIRPVVRFNYLGSFDKELSNELFTVSQLKTGENVSPLNRATAGIEMNLMVVNQQLDMQINYDTQTYTADQVKLFVHQYLSRLRELLSFIDNNKDQVRLKTSDFDTVTLSQEDLDTLFI